MCPVTGACGAVPTTAQLPHPHVSPGGPGSPFSRSSSCYSTCFSLELEPEREVVAVEAPHLARHFLPTLHRAHSTVAACQLHSVPVDGGSPTEALCWAQAWGRLATDQGCPVGGASGGSGGRGPAGNGITCSGGSGSTGVVAALRLLAGLPAASGSPATPSAQKRIQRPKLPGPGPKRMRTSAPGTARTPRLPPAAPAAPAPSLCAAWSEPLPGDWQLSDALLGEDALGEELFLEPQESPQLDAALAALDDWRPLPTRCFGL